ncbi:MAG: alpha/beta hydrolase [Candidatus Heimdallarchaeota archaeon]|nr:MAG: alpha/beta hydrolase [Candidatus Heimdallarchaeota archaeon]
MKDIQWQILNIYDEENLVEGVLQSLPAYLKVIFNIKANYTIKAYSPEGVTNGEIEGVSYHGFVELWRIPLFEKSGEWKLSIHLHDENQHDKKTTLAFNILPKLFENLSELEAEIESSRKEISIIWDDWLESFTTESPHVKATDQRKDFSKQSGLVVNEIQTSTEVMDDWMQTFAEKDLGMTEKDLRKEELEAYWSQINSELKIWQYIPHDLENNISKEFSIPILLIHGFSSDYTTWNSMAQYLWEGGFSNIFGMALYGDFYGLDRNCQHLDNVIKEVLKFTQIESIYLISHSFGGLVSRQFVKEYENRKRIQLLVTIAAPHYGIAKIFGRIMGSLKSRQLKKDAIDQEKLPYPTFEAYINHLEEKLESIQLTFTDEDLYILTMVNICGDKIYGGDGLFKAIEVPDMINFTVPSSHLSINKSKSTFNLIQSLMTGESVVYKITLIQVNPKLKSPPDLRFCMFIKPKTNPHYQRYPFQGFLQIEEKRLISQLPLIVFAYCKKEARNERLDIQIFDNENKKIAQKELFIGLGYKKEIGDVFEVETTLGYCFQFAVYSYKLHYKTKAAEKLEESGLWE